MLKVRKIGRWDDEDANGRNLYVDDEGILYVDGRWGVDGINARLSRKTIKVEELPCNSVNWKQQQQIIAKGFYVKYFNCV
jgi:hypothetical protein